MTPNCLTLYYYFVSNFVPSVASGRCLLLSPLKSLSLDADKEDRPPRPNSHGQVLRNAALNLKGKNLNHNYREKLLGIVVHACNLSDPEG